MVMLLRVIKDLTITIKRDNYDYRRVARPVEIVRRETINPIGGDAIIRIGKRFTSGNVNHILSETMNGNVQKWSRGDGRGDVAKQPLPP
jgi:hypothetical protein|tara:strand:+ start:80 stop:346 length:267 start_codon:yes stop_codon:yes gene_type:complete